MSRFRLAGREIGPETPALIIAEAGVNHNGDMAIARALIDAAADAGADVVKFQAFVTEEIATRSAPKAGYQRLRTDSHESQFDMLKALELDADQQAELMMHCRGRGVVFLSTPYDWPSVDLLDRLDVPGFKIASTDTTNLPFLRYVAAKGRPVILSTGMCDLGEVDAAVEALRCGPVVDMALLHCTTEYPANPAESNLRVLKTLRHAFHCEVGFSDHTPGIDVSCWAVAAGASMIEKHFTLDRSLPGPDHSASLEPTELAALVKGIRQVEATMGDGRKTPVAAELWNRLTMRKSLVSRRAIAEGEVIENDAIACKRPGTGLAPGMLDDVIGKRAARALLPDEVLTLSSIRWD